MSIRPPHRVGRETSGAAPAAPGSDKNVDQAALEVRGGLGGDPVKGVDRLPRQGCGPDRGRRGGAGRRSRLRAPRRRGARAARAGRHPASGILRRPERNETACRRLVHGPCSGRKPPCAAASGREFCFRRNHGTLWVAAASFLYGRAGGRRRRAGAPAGASLAAPAGRGWGAAATWRWRSGTFSLLRRAGCCIRGRAV